MLVDHLSTVAPASILIAGFVLIACAAVLLFNRFGHGINHIPGPSLWATTDFFRLFDAWGRRPDITQINLHKKYGSFVRMGPNCVSISDPEALKILYGFNSGFIKSDYYGAFRAIAKGQVLHSMVNIQEEKFHAKLRRSVSSAFAMSTLVQFEPLVDSTTTIFLQQLEDRFANRDDDSGVCDFGEWLQYYAFDVIGELTFSKRLGFVDSGKDVDDIISNLERVMNYVSLVGQMPIWDRILLKNPIRLWCSKVGLVTSTSPVVTYARNQMANHQVNSGIDKKDAPPRRDFLSRFKEAQKADSEFMSPERVLALTVGNVLGGSDSTAITLRTIFYFLLKTPSTLQRLLDELDEMDKAGKFSRDDELVQWNEVREWPYLTAVIKEALRIHPAVGVSFERIVPAAGATICGQFLPGGTIAGCSSWTIHLDEATFGSDVHAFRPERWLNTSKEKLTAMNNALLTFGAGSRVCLGKNISYLEMYKLVPALLRRFEVSLAYPEKEWTLHNAWLVKQSDFFVRFKTRKPKV